MKTPRSYGSIVASVLVALACCNVRLLRADAPATARSTLPSFAEVTAQESQDLKDALYYIASDELEGRGLMTEGLSKAADYIVDHFKSAGLQPLPGLDGYFQPFAISAGASVSEKTTLTSGVDDRSLKLKSDFSPLGVSSSGEFKDAPVAFVGYSIADGENGYNDFDGIDLKGKVALALRYGLPEHDDNNANRPMKPTSNTTFASKAKAAADHGAVALLIVNPPSRAGDRDRLVSLTRSAGEQAGIPVAQVTIDAADAMLKRAIDKDLEAVEAQVVDARKPHSFVLPNVTLSGNFDIDRKQREVKNVVAMLPGTGPHKGEYVVVGAHYDHLGRGEPGSLSFNSSEIHNGADDNGSGTVAVVELAKKLAASGAQQLDRSIIFVTFVGEERGLLGSIQFLKDPPVPIDKIHSMLNLDMVGRVRDETIFVGGTGTAAEFDALLKDAAEGSPLKVKTAGQDVGGKGGLGPSDHESFALKKVPVLFFFSGMHIDYHRPTDDPEKINYDGMAQVVDLSARVVERLAKLPHTTYVSDFDRSSFGGRGRGAGGNNVQLGIMPDYNPDESTPGVRIAGTVPNTAAEKAGLKEGDVLVELGDTKISSLEDLMSALGKAKAGDKVKLIIIRNKQRVETEATLTERRG